MTEFSMRGFVSELALIKVAQAEEDGNEPSKARWQDVARTVTQNVGAGALGYGLGSGLGYLGAEGLRRTPLLQGAGAASTALTPDMLKNMRRATGALGALGGIATLIALNKAQQRVQQAGQ